MPMLNKTAQVALILSLPFFLLIGAIRLVTSPAYVRYEYGKASFPKDNYGFPPEERLGFAISALEYVKNPLPADYLAKQTFESAPLYNNRELSHMVDVQRVFQSAWKGWGVASALLLVSAGWLAFAPGNRRRLARALETGGTITALAIFTIGFLAVIGWNTWFTLFHQLFFAAGSWTFNFTDTLIRLFPMPFWFDSALTVAGLTLTGGILVALAGYLLKTRRFSDSVL